MANIKIVGLGPGGKGYILPTAIQAIDAADIIAGSKRHLDMVETHGKRTFIVDGSFEPLLDFLEAHEASHQVVVLVSGDTGFYSLLRYIKRNLPDVALEVIPGISAMSVMFARLGMMYDDAYIGSAHGKALDILEWVREYNKVGLLTDKNNTPDKIAQVLMDAGLKQKRIAVGERLTYPDETVRQMTLEEAAEKRFEALNIVVIYDEDISI